MLTYQLFLSNITVAIEPLTCLVRPCHTIYLVKTEISTSNVQTNKRPTLILAQHKPQHCAIKANNLLPTCPIHF